MKYAIVTGASKGLGASIAEQLLKEGVHVIGIARQKNTQLRGNYQHINCDLADVEQLDKTISAIADQVFKKDVELVYLINNAATVNPIDTACNQTIEAIQAHMQINLIAPMITSSLLLKRAANINTQVIIANVSSGAAERSTYGWSAYGASKAGLNRYTDTVALEQKELNTGNKVVLLDPSIMDTKMQDDIRSTNPESFQAVDQFKQYKEENKLRDTAVVAKAFVDVLCDPSKIENGYYYRINELL